MRKLFFGLILSIASQAASAQWVKIEENDTVVTYADRATIRKSGGLVTMWVMNDMMKERKWPNGMTVLSAKRHKEFDCKNSRHRETAMILYTGRRGTGSTVHSSFDQQDWQPVPPGTQVETAWEVACRGR